MTRAVPVMTTTVAPVVTVVVAMVPAEAHATDMPQFLNDILRAGVGGDGGGTHGGSAREGEPKQEKR